MGDLIKLVILGLLAIATAIAAFFVVNEVVYWKTNKEIHEHLQKFFSAFAETIKQWSQKAVGYMKIALQLVASEGYVSGKRALRAIGYSSTASQGTVTVTEVMISPEEAAMLGFSMNVNNEQELDYMTMAA